MIASKYLQASTVTVISALAAVFLVSILCTVLFGGTVAHGANVNDFRAGNIIGNSVFRNNGSMTASQIQNFLNQKNSVCLKNYRAPSLIDKNGNGQVEDWTSAERYGGPTGKQTMSAAELIKAASDIYKINPQVLLVTLQKEQGLITRSDCPDWRYRTAFGYGCPDTAACDSAAFGFTTQIDNAAYHFKGYYQDSISYNPFTKGTYRISYNPDSRCGNTQVDIENEATAALYSYTPYQPNTYAKNGGTIDTYSQCGAFGNLNFWKFFVDWFGSTQYTVRGGIGEKYNSLGGASGILGDILSNERCGLTGGGCYQVFQNGSIYWSSTSGAHPVRGGIGSKWASLSYEIGTLGYPISSEVYQNGTTYQDFEGGRIYWINNSAIPTAGGIGKRYKNIQYSDSALGLPTENERCVLKNGGCYQSYQNGAILWSPKTGAWESYGDVRTRWSQLGFENGRMGYPVGPVVCGLKNSGCYQSYQNGAIVGNSTTGYWESVGAIRTRWSQLGFENGRMGYPVGGETYNTSTKRTSQQYENGTIFWTSQSGAWASF